MGGRGGELRINLSRIKWDDYRRKMIKIKLQKTTVGKNVKECKDTEDKIKKQKKLEEG